MYGGGQWTTQNKVLGGAYINFISAARVTTNLSERGVASMSNTVHNTNDLDGIVDGLTTRVLEAMEIVRDGA